MIVMSVRSSSNGILSIGLVLSIGLAAACTTTLYSPEKSKSIAVTFHNVTCTAAQLSNLLVKLISLLLDQLHPMVT